MIESFKSKVNQLLSQPLQGLLIVNMLQLSWPLCSTDAAAAADVDMLQLMSCQGVVIQLLLQNGLAEVLCNVIHCLSEILLSSVDAVCADIELLFCAVARVTFWYYFHHLCCVYVVTCGAVLYSFLLCLTHSLLLQ